MQRSATTVWTGDLRQGKGKISTQSGALTNTPYGYNTRMENAPGTNPEELIAAAHSSCFSMALAAKLTEAGLAIDNIHTSAAVTLEKTDGGLTITAVHLDLKAKMPNTDQKTFLEIANKAKEGCPVSKVLNAKITLDAKLE